MILLDDFYHVTRHHLSDGVLQATLSFHPTHRIFEGHFPGQPVVPGVCMMHIVKELAEAFLLEPGTRTRLVRADTAKFLTMIDPRQTPTVEAEVQARPGGSAGEPGDWAGARGDLAHASGEGGEIKMVARFYNEATTYFKLTAVLRTYG